MAHTLLGVRLWQRQQGCQRGGRFLGLRYRR